VRPVPSSSTLAAFAAAAFVLIAVPGPNMIYLVARSLSEGRRAGMLSALGIETGTLVHTTAAAVGLSALLASSATAFAVVKYAGAAYLVYLGLRALLARSGSDKPAAEAPAVAGGHVYRQAVLTQVLNPKVAIFFLAFLPQFVSPQTSAPLQQMLVLSAVFMAMTFAVFVVYGVLANAFRKAVIESPRVQAWLRRTFAGAFAGLGINLALSER
jgi:threonine/homoserine/homoserine lactone efflux protein